VAAVIALHIGSGVVKLLLALAAPILKGLLLFEEIGSKQKWTEVSAMATSGTLLPCGCPAHWPFTGSSAVTATATSFKWHSLRRAYISTSARATLLLTFSLLLPWYGSPRGFGYTRFLGRRRPCSLSAPAPHLLSAWIPFSRFESMTTPSSDY